MVVNTTWVSPSSATLDKTTGNTIDETMTDAWSSDLYHLGGTVGYIGCHAQSAGAQSINTATPTVAALGAEGYDSDPNGAMHDNAVNNSRITIRTTGVYHLSAYAQWATDATGYRTVEILADGATTLTQDIRMAVTGTGTAQTAAIAYLLAASSYVEIRATQTSGGALNLEGAILTAVKA